MTERTGGLRSALSIAGAYRALQRAVGSSDSHPRFLREHARPVAGERVLDIGCGPGDIFPLLPEGVEYLGVDASERYIAAARDRFGDRAEFTCADVRRADVGENRFDLVLIMGLVHHLDDDASSATFGLAARALRDSGRLVAIEPAYANGQSRVARWLISRDRGACVRTADAYGEMAEPWFGRVETTVRHDLLRVPYTHAVIEAEGPQRAGGA